MKFLNFIFVYSSLMPHIIVVIATNSRHMVLKENDVIRFRAHYLHDLSIFFRLKRNFNFIYRIRWLLLYYALTSVWNGNDFIEQFKCECTVREFFFSFSVVAFRSLSFLFSFNQVKICSACFVCIPCFDFGI